MKRIVALLPFVGLIAIIVIALRAATGIGASALRIPASMVTVACCIVAICSAAIYMAWLSKASDYLFMFSAAHSMVAFTFGPLSHEASSIPAFAAMLPILKLLIVISCGISLVMLGVKCNALLHKESETGLPKGASDDNRT